MTELTAGPRRLAQSTDIFGRNKYSTRRTVQKPKEDFVVGSALEDQGGLCKGVRFEPNLKGV